MKNKKDTVVPADDSISVRLFEIDIRKQEISIIDTRIENARRNVQLLGNFCFQYQEKDSPDELKDFNKEAMEALMLNVKILKETGNIK
jgi:hypothetical protein